MLHNAEHYMKSFHLIDCKEKFKIDLDRHENCLKLIFFQIVMLYPMTHI